MNNLVRIVSDLLSIKDTLEEKGETNLVCDLGGIIEDIEMNL